MSCNSSHYYYTGIQPDFQKSMHKITTLRVIFDMIQKGNRKLHVYMGVYINKQPCKFIRPKRREEYNKTLLAYTWLEYFETKDVLLS